MMKAFITLLLTMVLTIMAAIWTMVHASLPVMMFSIFGISTVGTLLCLYFIWFSKE
jgi:hypothetical protein